MVDKGLLSPEEKIIFEAYDFRCVLHPWAWADALHEEPPRSLNPRWEDEPEKRYPVCHDCHEELQSEGREVAEQRILAGQRTFYPTARERIVYGTSRTREAS